MTSPSRGRTPAPDHDISRRIALGLGGAAALAFLTACTTGGGPSTTPTTTGKTTGKAPAMPAIEGIRTVDCAHPVPRLVTDFQQAATGKGLTVFATVDHAAGAAKAGTTLRPTTLVIVGNPQGGTPFMQDQQLMGLVLPLRVLFWEDDAGKTHASYEEISWYVKRFGLGEKSAGAQKNVAQALDALVAGVAKG
ncbi:Uncharacterized conserved protein, DUF302 family [Austwickia chelonae]|uniref:DUF302 domain-containing protein n=1 Tax=Austwickia chelonae NBRC 105200 TaxID=1184607 RepID=K6VPU9_9MICO|nr:DUF302 domain-containing protein [Austwickia chelonae]GAB78769.1 hypothetical protein AUCHE_16_01920 [Austwickia chelonae NBRC 105200]SEW35326.1 Uncharacterized conserved protein, DUF302 family [Austwickia chelonae]